MTGYVIEARPSGKQHFLVRLLTSNLPLTSSRALHGVVILGLFSINLPISLLPLPSFFSSVETNYSPSRFWNPTFPDEGLWDTFVKQLPAGSFSYTISLDRLRSGVAYEFRVIAVNRFGYGDPSPPSTAMSGNLPHYITPLHYIQQWCEWQPTQQLMSVPQHCFCLGYITLDTVFTLTNDSCIHHNSFFMILLFRAWTLVFHFIFKHLAGSTSVRLYELWSTIDSLCGLHCHLVSNSWTFTHPQEHLYKTNWRLIWWLKLLPPLSYIILYYIILYYIILYVCVSYTHWSKIIASLLILEIFLIFWITGQETFLLKCINYKMYTIYF